MKRLLAGFVLIQAIFAGSVYATILMLDAGNLSGTPDDSGIGGANDVGIAELTETPAPGTTVLIADLSSTMSSGTNTLGQLFTTTGGGYIEIVMDMNEQGNNSGDDWSIDSFQFDVGGETVYSLDMPVTFNPTGSPVDSNNGGGDIDGRLLIPTSLFAGRSAADPFKITTVFSDTGAASDSLLIGNFNGTGVAFDPSTIPEPIPEPSTTILLGLCVLAAFIKRRR